MAFSATEFTFPPIRGFKYKEGSLEPVQKNAFLSRSQDLEPWFHDVGQIYMARCQHWISTETIYSGNSTFFYMKPNEVQDIDTYHDLMLAELKLKLLS